MGDEGSQYFSMATVWEKGSLLHDTIDHMPSRIRDEISGAMTALAAEYYKQNPSGPLPLGIIRALGVQP
jgi:hypothetical protein